MVYPKEFIEELKEIFPEWIEAHNLAEKNDVFLGSLLLKTFTNTIPINDILNAKSLESLRTEAFKLKIRRDLYFKWCNLYNNQEY